MKENIIFEELSVSNEVLQTTNNIRNIICDDLNNIEPKRDWTRCLGIYAFVKENILNLQQPIFGIIEKIDYHYILFETAEDYKQAYSKYDFGAYVDFDNKILHISFFGFNNEIFMRFLNSTLSHEIHHIFQDLMYNASSKISDIYKISTYILNNQNSFKDYITEIAKLIYFFDKKEIEANMESLYQELKAEHNINKNQVLIDYHYNKMNFDFYKSCISVDDDMENNILNTFNIPLKKILNYITKQMLYFNTKVKHIYVKIHNEKLINESQKRIFRKYYNI